MSSAKTIIRQRPALGDSLLLAPLIRRVYETTKKPVNIITDSSYGQGVLVESFSRIPGVGRVQSVLMKDMTTPSNVAIDPALKDAAQMRLGKHDIDCNADFMWFERAHNGNPPYGIAEFWLRHHGLFVEGMDMKPKYTVDDPSRRDVDEWLECTSKPILGIVMRAGDRVRDWNYSGKAEDIMNWAYTTGFHPVSIDTRLRTNSMYGQACVGKRLPFVAALIERCSVVLTPDTGLLHLAEAVGTKTVSLWGTVSPALRTLHYDTRILPKQLIPRCPPEARCPCCSWGFQHYSCVRQIKISEITDAIGGML